MAVPSQFFRSVFREVEPRVKPTAPVLSVVKGIERGSLQRMTEVMSDESDHDPSLIGVLSGPNVAREIAAGEPAATVIALGDEVWADRLQHRFVSPTFRVYTNPDVVGCEIAGAVKNVIAIAAGVADGLGYGANTMAALLTRGLAELVRLGTAVGGQPLTFLGLAGNGRPRRHVQQREEPEPPGGRRAGPRVAASTRSSGPCTWWPRAWRRRRACWHWPPGSAWRCRSPSRCRPSSKGGVLPPRRWSG